MPRGYRRVANKRPVATPEPPAPEPARIDLPSLRKDDLANLAAATGVSPTGTKTELIQRLEGKA
jgi:hypothetical protein